MGCGCVTPGSTVHMNNSQYVHSIKVSKIQRRSKRKIGERQFGEQEIRKKPLTKKEMQNSKKRLNFDPKLKFNQKSQGSNTNLRRVQIVSIEDFSSQGSTKNNFLKFRQTPKYSIKLQNIEKGQFEENEQFKIFQKENYSPKKLQKKTKHFANRTKTEDVQYFKAVESQFYRDDNYPQATDQNNFQEMKKNSLSRHKLPKIGRVQTEQCDPYLLTLKSIVLFGDKKDQEERNEQWRKKKTANFERKKIRIPTDFDSLIDRLHFKKKKMIV